MLTIVLNWIYILITTFCLGFAFTVFVEKVLHYRMRRMDSVLMTGIAIATVYAQIFSLFYRVNVEANVILLLICLLAAIIWRKQMCSFLVISFQGCSLLKKVLILLLFLVWSYYTSRGYMVPDTDLYHAQSIRWIEEYGVVKGLGNLHSRFAYNSSIFAVSALYSMIFLLGRSMHAVNGWIALVLSVGLLDLGKCFQRKNMLLSDFARVGAVYYLTLIWDEIVSPSSDYAVMLVIFFIVVKWLTQLEDRENKDNIAPYALLCVLGVFALTLKLTAGLILVLLIKPAGRLLKEKRWKEIAIYLALGLLTAVPWMIRTVIISGWLFYPFPALDLFSFDWKMRDIGVINSDAGLIKTWGRNANELGIDAALAQWFPQWFTETLSFTEKLLIVGDIVSCVLVILTGIRILAKKMWRKLDILLVLLAILGSYLFWQLSAPLPRYGYAYMLLLVVLTLGYLLRNEKVRTLIHVFLLVYGIYKLYLGWDQIMNSYLGAAYVWQADYGTYEVEPYEMGSVTIYASKEWGLTGYDPFPASIEVKTDVGLRGEGLKDGFWLMYY